MKSRKGSIIILALIVMIVIFISVSYLMYLTQLQSSITSSSINKVQSVYLAESKINEAFYNDKCMNETIIPAAIKYLKATSVPSNAKVTIPVDLCCLGIEDEDRCVLLEFSKPLGKPFCMEIFAKSNYKGIENKMMAYGPLLNPLFANNLATLYSYDSDFKTILRLENFLKSVKEDICIKDIPSTMVGISTFDHDNINVSYKNTTTNVIKAFRNGNKTCEMDIKDDIFLVIKNKLNTPIKLNIEPDPINLIKLKGIIYLEGDLVISSKFQFTGILILKDGNIIVSGDDKPMFKGVILTNAYVNFLDKIEMKAAYDEVCKYGVYLPGFLEPHLEVVKKY